MNLEPKSPAIAELVAAVRSRYGDARVRIVDYWPDDSHTIGFERTTTDDAMVSVTTKDKPPGRYDVSVDVPDREAADDPYLGSGSYSDCVIDGLLATLRKYLIQAAVMPRQVARNFWESGRRGKWCKALSSGHWRHDYTTFKLCFC
jgi:hypothetical protein